MYISVYGHLYNHSAACLQAACTALSLAEFIWHANKSLMLCNMHQFSKAALPRTKMGVLIGPSILP